MIRTKSSTNGESLTQFERVHCNHGRNYKESPSLSFQGDNGSIVINEMNSNNFIWIDALGKPLFNGENRSSLSCIYQKLFKKYPLVSFFGMGSRFILLNNQTKSIAEHNVDQQLQSLLKTNRGTSKN
jgi:hypothetical protein